MPGAKGRSGGRNAKTVSEHKRAGTFDPTRHKGFENPAAPSGRPGPPMPLDGLALDEWARMITRLETTGALSVVDDGAIFQHCRLFAETEGIWIAQQETAESIRILQQNFDELPRGEVSAAQIIELAREIAIMRKLEAGYITKVRQGRMALRVMLVEFGLTPAARGRVKLPEKPKDADSFTAFQNAKPGSQIVRVK